MSSDPNASSPSASSGNGRKTRKRGAKANETLMLREEVQKNSEALNELKDVPKKLEQLFELIVPPEVLEEGEDEAEYEQEVSVLDENNFDKLLKGQGKHNDIQSGESTVNNALLDILNVTQQETEYGTPLDNDVAISLSRLYKSEASKTTKENLKEKFKVPENCKDLDVPKVNTEIWTLLPTGYKQKDYALQQQQQFISNASVAVAKLAETLYTTKDQISQSLRESLLKTSMDAATAIAIASDDMNRKRKFELRPALNKEFSSICGTSRAGAGLLFGENILEQVKATKSSSQLIRPAATRGFTRGARFRPYTSTRTLNFQGPPRRGRGAYRPFPQRQRGRPFFRNSQQHQQY